MYFIVYFAAQEGRLDCLKLLFEKLGGDVTICSNDGMTPLHAATQSGQLKVADWLVSSAGCEITKKSMDGGTGVHFAAAKGKFICVNWFGCLMRKQLKHTCINTVSCSKQHLSTSIPDNLPLQTKDYMTMYIYICRSSGHFGMDVFKELGHWLRNG